MTHLQASLFSAGFVVILIVSLMCMCACRSEPVHYCAKLTKTISKNLRASNLEVKLFLSLQPTQNKCLWKCNFCILIWLLILNQRWISRRTRQGRKSPTSLKSMLLKPKCVLVLTKWKTTLDSTHCNTSSVIHWLAYYLRKYFASSHVLTKQCVPEHWN